ncbi:Ubiquitin carboxyl-terminal hydrolase [Quillaja saponaria]|uniref:Ubiquitin carboxyl-terminal hydrolase n=1 Tax=Quillaja saponaria TaxID=32244 RepID=A0AAD7KZL4_QUISA|nr:Ubiquitin carboxyl-terminal hydrolase [Quillaja saponaria]KAJ7948874.1 Ubiquitin carboxyl-terminal hydrolase [Quillaja saponaria]
MALQLQMSWQPSLLSQKRKTGPPLGLRNLGNSCYLNSVLQCLTYTPPLANFCLRNQHSSLCDSTSEERKQDCPFCILEKRIVRSLRADLNLDAPAKIQSCLRIFAEHFRCGRQEDAHEFLRYVIDACHNTCIRLKKLRRKGAESVNGSGGTTVVNDIFGGALQSQVKCLSCGNESNKVDEIMDISLDVLHSNSLKEAMQKFFLPEVLDGNNKYKCDNCKKLVAAKKQMSILQAPNVLVIQLKRFEGMFGSKIDKAVTFEEILVLSSFMCKASQDPQPEYKLFGTIVHSGYSLESGHYYAYIKDAMGRWYCCNDSFVSLSTLQEVLSEKVYILFFSRTNQRTVSLSNAVASNGVKSRDCNGSEASESPNIAAPLKSVHARPTVEQSSKKDVPTISKVGKVPSSPRVKFNFVGNSSSKKGPVTVNGKVDVHKSQPTVMNGHVNDSIYMITEKDSSSISRNGFEKNRKVTAVNGEKGQQFVLSNGKTDGIHSVGISLVKPDLSKDISTRTSLMIGRGAEGHKLESNGLKSKCGISGNKRKYQESSCILLAKDDLSRGKVKELKEVLKHKASSVLRSCGWLDNVHNFMRSRKRSCAREVGDTPSTDELKSLLIADARGPFNSQIPEPLKENLIERLQSFSQGKTEFSGP